MASGLREEERRDRSESMRVANTLDCRLGNLPLNYLGFVIRDKVVRSQSASKLFSKLDSRLNNWKSNLLSSGGRLVLVNSCLSSISTYTMEFYRLNAEIRRRMDTIRSRFFWRGASDKFKYNMVSWKAVCRLKDFGGLGVINTSLFNDCLLAKWFWKMDKATNKIWFQLLKAKYFPRDNYRDSNFANGSLFWKSIQKVKHLFFRGVVHKLGDGSFTLFWKDVRYEDCPFTVRFNKLFLICSNPDSFVDHCYNDGVWNIEFSRSLGAAEMLQWRDLITILKGVVLSREKDSLIWGIGNHGIFSVKSLYRFLSFEGITCKRFQVLWASRIPLKVKIFLWQVYINRIQTTDQLKIRGWKGDINCALCGVPENINHVFFNCVLAKFVWYCFKEMFQWRRVPNSLDDFHH